MIEFSKISISYLTLIVENKIDIYFFAAHKPSLHGFLKRVTYE